jgi:hypothetical protein
LQVATVATIPDVTPLSYLSSTPKEQLLRREQPETLLGFLEPKAEMDPKGSERIRKDQLVTETSSSAMNSVLYISIF